MSMSRGTLTKVPLNLDYEEKTRQMRPQFELEHHKADLPDKYVIMYTGTRIAQSRPAK
jgi:hypothetical protein